VAALVPVGNQIRFDTQNPEPEKYSKQTADRPQLKIEVQGFAPGAQGSCSMWNSRLIVLLKIDSGEQRLNRGLLPLAYACTKALVNCSNGKDKLRNVDIPFVVAINKDLDGFAQQQNYLESDGEKEWTAFCRVILTLRFDDYQNLP